MSPKAYLRVKKHRAKKRLLGLCYDCNKPAVNSGRCEFHHMYNLKALRKKYRKRVENRRCGRCSAPLPEDWENVLCPNCSTFREENRYATIDCKGALKFQFSIDG